MIRVLAPSSTRPNVVCFAFLALLMMSIAPLAVRGAEATEDITSWSDPQRIEAGVAQERLVVDPEPQWHGWGVWRDGWHDGGPRIKVWVDRGDWATYRPGDRLWVYFRVDRPCFVTIIDYAPDGRVDVAYPNRWSGSNFVRPDRTYRVPERRRYSLRIAGPGGVEKLVACAHQAPWPSGPRGRWIPPSWPRRGRVVLGRPGVHVLPGRPGRVVGQRRAWPIPDEWYGTPTRWGCDSVSFYVDDDGWGDDGSRHDKPWNDGFWREDPRRQGRDVFHDRFKMRRCGESFYRDAHFGGRSFAVNIECTESRSGEPTEIVGRVIWDDGRGSRPLFRLDVDGQHGDRPAHGRVYASEVGPLRIEIEIDDFEIKRSKKHWSPARIDWIRFDVRVFGS